MNEILLKSFIILNRESQARLAQSLGLSNSAFNAKLKGKYEFRPSEIVAIAKRYNMTGKDIIKVFFPYFAP